MFGTRQLRHPKASKTRLFAETAHIDGNITSSLAREPGVRAGRAPRRLYGRIYDVPNVLNRGISVAESARPRFRRVPLCVLRYHGPSW